MTVLEQQQGCPETEGWKRPSRASGLEVSDTVKWTHQQHNAKWLIIQLVTVMRAEMETLSMYFTDIYIDSYIKGRRKNPLKSDMG